MSALGQWQPLVRPQLQRKLGVSRLDLSLCRLWVGGRQRDREKGPGEQCPGARCHRRTGRGAPEQRSMQVTGAHPKTSWRPLSLVEGPLAASGWRRRVGQLLLTAEASVRPQSSGRCDPMGVKAGPVCGEAGSKGPAWGPDSSPQALGDSIQCAQSNPCPCPLQSDLSQGLGPCPAHSPEPRGVPSSYMWSAGSVPGAVPPTLGAFCHQPDSRME